MALATSTVRNIAKSSSTVLKKFSTSATLNKVYEWRVYSIKPDQFKPFMELTQKNIHLRTKHSPLVGYWFGEIGGVNDVLHLWEYDTLDQRAGVRLALSQDADWLSNYISKITPMMARQENALLEPVGPTNLSKPDLKGVYEMQQFSCKGNLQDLQNRKRGDATLLGTFKGILGPMNTGYQLWYHKSPDAFLKNATAGQDSSIEGSGHSRLILPAAWSPLK